MEEKSPEQEQVESNTVPSFSFNDNQVVIDTFDIELNVNNEDVIIKVRKLTSGEHRELVKKTASIKVVGTQPNASMDSVGYQIGVLSKVITEAPFPTTEAFISSLPEEISTYLFNEYKLVTGSVSSDKKKD
ncbi:MAG: hypothetical protein ACTSQA_00210 [Candidatus Heimdallarchaeaceae archaeon]